MKYEVLKKNRFTNNLTNLDKNTTYISHVEVPNAVHIYNIYVSIYRYKYICMCTTTHSINNTNTTTNLQKAYKTFKNVKTS